MKTKLEMAHEHIMKSMEKSKPFASTDDLIKWGWEYADKMQAEEDKRKVSGVPEAIRENSHIFGSPAPVRPFLTKDKDGNCTHFHHEFGHKKCMDCGACLEQWQPDWSQAPEWANYWYTDGLIAMWSSHDPKSYDPFDIKRCPFGLTVDTAPTFNYQGDWIESLRVRP